MTNCSTETVGCWIVWMRFQLFWKTHVYSLRIAVPSARQGKTEVSLASILSTGEGTATRRLSHLARVIKERLVFIPNLKSGYKIQSRVH